MKKGQQERKQVAHVAWASEKVVPRPKKGEKFTVPA
jgi:hypothetical protein